MLWSRLVISLFLCGVVNADDYSARTLVIEGWTVHVRDSLFVDQPRETERALGLLTEQLKLVVAAIPDPILADLRQVPLYMSPVPEGQRPKAEYHPSRKWLEENGRNPAMARCVEFTNVAIFDREVKRMPVFVLHELAHAYHHRVLGYDQPAILDAYEKAVASKSYDDVSLRATGKKRRAYAMTNHKEYFAESSEAFFGINDFYPFDKDDLRKHDPQMFEALRAIWRVEP